MSIEVSCLEEKRGSLLKITFGIEKNNHSTGKIHTESFDIDNLVEVRFTIGKVVTPGFYSVQTSPYSISLEISYKTSSFLNSGSKNVLIYLDVTCNEPKYSGQFVCTEQWTDWIKMGEISVGGSGGKHKADKFEVSMIASKKDTMIFAKLYDDTDTADFQLSTAEGSISVHKAFLAAHSDTFRTMSRREWKETINASMQMQGVTLRTLHKLKDYIYLNAVPNDTGDLRKLLVLASHYSMDTLKTECIKKLSHMVTSENLQSLLEYACANNLPELIFAIIEQTSSEVVHAARLNRKPRNKLQNDLPNELQNGDVKSGKDASEEEDN